MITYTTILGSAAQAEYAERLHDLEHKNQVDYVMLSSDDIQRRRLKVITKQGNDCGIALARDQQLYGGAILSLSDEFALVVRCTDVQWLRCLPVDSAAALELGYFAGNMHWAVRFAGQVLEIEIKGRVEDYQDRLQALMSKHRIQILTDTSTATQESTQDPGLSLSQKPAAELSNDLSNDLSTELSTELSTDLTQDLTHGHHSHHHH